MISREYVIIEDSATDLASIVKLVSDATVLGVLHAEIHHTMKVSGLPLKGSGLRNHCIAPTHDSPVENYLRIQSPVLLCQRDDQVGFKHIGCSLLLHRIGCPRK
jgi:hypothetical protein